MRARARGPPLATVASVSTNQPQQLPPSGPETSGWHWDHAAAFGQPGSAPQPEPGVWARFRRRAFSNLNLNGRTPPRVHPAIGEWGPVKVPTTKQKKRMRIYVGIALPAAMLLCFLLGWYVYFMMTGCYGFGFGCRTPG